jgi:hypothetical protein
MIDAIASFFRTYRSLEGFFSAPLTPETSLATIRRHVEQRDALFLAMMRDRAFTQGSPYRALLDLARCEYRDVEVMVKQRGVEPALDALRRAGVCLSFEEFKNGAEVHRGGRVFRFTPDQFDPPNPSGGIGMRSGGTRSAGTWIFLPIEHLALTHTPQYGMTLGMFAPGQTPVLTWQLGFPSGAGQASWFSLAKLRRPADRWFSLTQIPRGIGGRWQSVFRAARFLAKRAGIAVPLPEYTPVAEVARVMDAIRAALARAGRCLVVTTPSCAVRLAAEARGSAASLRGVTFLTGGEPLTTDKIEDIRRSGAAALSQYSVTEAGGSVAGPCGAPSEPGDMHFRSDALAMITNPRTIGDVSVDAIMLTSLLPTAPKILLNVETDDFGRIEQRACGCLWDQAGCTTHLLHIRSFTKLTGEGTTLLGSNCVHIIERVLPSTFGGSSVDYQLVEAEDEQHLTRLFLFISPRVGPLDEQAVLLRFAEELQGTATRPLGGRRQIWEQAGSVRVVRQDPISTGMGKLLPFHTLGAGTLGSRDASPLKKS